MRHLLLTPLLLSACVVHQDPCIGPLPKEYNCVEMDRSDRASFVDHNPRHAVDDGDNGSGSASSDAVSDDSNGDGSDE